MIIIICIIIIIVIMINIITMILMIITNTLILLGWAQVHQLSFLKKKNYEEELIERIAENLDTFLKYSNLHGLF